MASKTASQLRSLLATFSFEPDMPHQMTNGFLAHLFFNECKKSYPETILRIQQLSGLSIKKVAMRSKLVSLQTLVSSKLKSLQKGNTWENLFTEFNKLYQLPVELAETLTVLTPNVFADEPQPSTSTSLPNVPSVQILRTDCVKCVESKTNIVKLQQKHSVEKRILQNKLVALKKHFEVGSSGVRKKLSEKALELKDVKKRLERKSGIESSLRKKRSELKSEMTNLKRKLERIKDRHTAAQEIKKLKIQLAHQVKESADKNKKLETMKSELNVMKGEVKELKDSNDFLISCLRDVDENVSEEGEKGRMFNTNMRKATYRAILAQCPVAQVGNLLKAVISTLTETSVEKTPSKSTAARMTHELSVLSSIQTVECVLQASVATISWDATTELGHHINEIHIRLADGTTHTISINRLAGGKGEDYSDHIIRSIDEMCETYADFHGMVFAVVRGKVLSKMLSALTDRAVVNHKTCRLINLHLGLELIEMNCNLHVLDGFANQVRKALKVLDSKTGLDGGKYCLASKVIYTISKLRYKNTGDPTGFKAFLRVNNIPAGMFVRYVGNRLHVMFHMGGVIIHYLEVLLAYLKESCKSEYSRKSLMEELNSKHLVSQLQAIGLVGKLITGPWMRFVYKNEDDLSNLQMSGHFRTAQLMIEAWSTNPSEMVTSDKDVFMQPLIHDPVLESLRSFNSIDVNDVLKAVLPSISSVISKQLGRYVSGDLSNPSPDLLARTASAAPHNIWAERVIGMTCQLWKRCPMATIGFLDSKIKAKTNKTMEWLDAKENDAQERLVSFARRRAGVLRKLRKENEREVDEEIEVRMRVVAQARSSKSRKQVDEDVKKAFEEKNLDAAVFQQIHGIQQERLQQMMEKDEVIVGALFEHRWYDKQLRKDCTWNARVVEMGEKEMVVSYWRVDELEEESEDSDVRIVDVMADIVLGDVIFI